MPPEILLIGQGLAGSLLAWQLIQQQRRVLVIDNGLANASYVAAGLINPITGQRLVKTADIDGLLPAALLTYQNLSQQAGIAFYQPLPMLRLINQPTLQSHAERRLQQPEYQNWLKMQSNIDISGHHCLLQQHTGYLRTQALLSYLQNYLIKRNSYQQIQLDYAQIDPHQPIWQSNSIKHVVFCEGYLASNNPWFGYLPLQPLQGEILTCQTAEYCPPHILNYGHWLLPINDHEFKLGATQIPNCTDLTPSHHARQTLLNGLAPIRPALHQSSHVLEHAVGIRPATVDRHPLLGTHPRYPKLHIFNGFGSKGSLSIPWYAQQMANYLSGLDFQFDTADIRRFNYVQ